MWFDNHFFLKLKTIMFTYYMGFLYAHLELVPSNLFVGPTAKRTLEGSVFSLLLNNSYQCLQKGLKGTIYHHSKYKPNVVVVVMMGNLLHGNAQSLVLAFRMCILYIFKGINKSCLCRGEAEQMQLKLCHTMLLCYTARLNCVLL